GPALLGVLLRELEADAGVRAGDQNGLGAREGPCEQRGEAQDSAERNARTAAAEQLAHEPILLCALAEEASIVDDTVTGRDGAARMRIDFVSDVVCPWCAIGLNALERALERIGSDVGAVELHMQPFELNQAMEPDGVDAAEYMRTKYGLASEQLAANRARIVERGAAEGFTFGERSHIWNTF